MRSFLRVLLLLVVLVSYGIQAGASQFHTHTSADRSHCAACAFHASPSLSPQVLAVPLPTHLAWARAVVRLPDAPPAPLDPLDVSFSTSPPMA